MAVTIPAMTPENVIEFPPAAIPKLSSAKIVLALGGIRQILALA